MKFTAEVIADFLKGDIVGDKKATVTTVAKIEEGRDGALSFLSNPKYEQYIYDSLSSVIIVNRSFKPQKQVKATMIKVDDAYSSFAKLLELYAANLPQKQGISKQAAISESVEMGKECYVGEFAVVGDGVKMGDGCKVYPQVYIGDQVRMGNGVIIHAGAKIYAKTVIGNNVTINAGAVIGADGFGFAPDSNGVFSRIPQIGNVVLEDNVDIGANTCIDCATIGSTTIHKGVKLDNLIQIAHNVVIGENTVAASQTGIAGSTKIGANCMIGGQVGIIGHLEVGDKVQIGSKSGIANNLKSGSVYFGSPAMIGTGYHRSFAIFRNLPQLSTDVNNLKKQIKKLEDK